MQTADTNLATDWSRGRPRTLIVKDGAVWIWPGIPLAMKLDRAVQPLPPDWVQSWITALHGFEARYPQLEAALARASAYLTAGDEGRAQQALDLAAIDRFSPEGAALMRAVAVDLGISPLDMAVGTKSLPWGAGNQLAYLSLFRRFGGAAQAFEKGGNPNQPRWPGGTSGRRGGRYAPADAGVGSTTGTPNSTQPGIGHNGGPPLEDPPEIPEEEPPSAQLRNAIVKDLARWLLRRGVAALIPGAGEALLLLQIGVWIYQYLPYINAYLSGPKTLDELNDDAEEQKEGYQIHHIVEQGQARAEGYSKDQIDSRENRVRISTLKHWEINGWYGRPNPRYGGLSPRQYLSSRSWADKVEVGHQALIDAGVLKP